MADYLPLGIVVVLMAFAGSADARGPAEGAVETKPVLDPATGFAVGAPSVADPVEAEYERLLAFDDEAQEEIDRLIREADALGDKADTPALQRKVDERMGAVTRAYQGFIEKHPSHARARIAFGSYLNDTAQEDAAKAQWEKALELDPKNPAIYNNLAGIYGHRGPITQAFTYFEKAIELSPDEPVYYQNLATTVFLFRKDVMEHYAITNEQRVFDKALGLYRKAMELDPTNFILAADTAQTYYGIRPPRHEEALAAWRKAYELASDDLEREGVRVHFARIQVELSRFDEARTNLALITHPNFQVVKERIGKTLERKSRGGSDAVATEVEDASPNSGAAKSAAKIP
ncbi:MAG: tetratricopeptide repeat protein [Limisphaerales bacterium]